MLFGPQVANQKAHNKRAPTALENVFGGATEAPCSIFVRPCLKCSVQRGDHRGAPQANGNCFWRRYPPPPKAPPPSHHPLSNSCLKLSLRGCDKCVGALLLAEEVVELRLCCLLHSSCRRTVKKYESSVQCCTSSCLPQRCPNAVSTDSWWMGRSRSHHPGSEEACRRFLLSQICHCVAGWGLVRNAVPHHEEHGHLRSRMRRPGDPE